MGPVGVDWIVAEAVPRTVGTAAARAALGKTNDGHDDIDAPADPTHDTITPSPTPTESLPLPQPHLPHPDPHNFLPLRNTLLA